MTDRAHGAEDRPKGERAREPLHLRFWRSLRTIALYGTQKFVGDRTTLLAAALAYRTVFSLVPMLVLAVVAVRSFADPDTLRDRLFAWFALDEITLTVPAEDADGGEEQVELERLVDRFVDQAMARLTEINFTAITAVGVAILIYAALSLLIQMEQAFNAVYRATTARTLGMRLTIYWSILTLGSLTLVISFAVSDWVGTTLRELPGGFTVTSALAEFVTTVGITWLVLTFAYLLMPTTRVRLRPAAAGAAIAAGLWELAKQGLTWFVGTAMSGQVSIYGSLALIPIFLLWIQITWMIVLIGLQISYAIQHFSTAALLRSKDHARERDPLLDPAVGVVLMREIARRFREGKASSLESLADGANVTELMAKPILERLADAGFLNKVERAEKDDYALARPAEDIQVNQVLKALRELIPDPRSADDARVLDRLLDTQQAATEGLTLAELDRR